MGRIILQITVIFILVVMFQNCSPTAVFSPTTLAKPSEAVDNGNGGHYDGKILYLLADLNNLCSDGTSINSRIEKILDSYYLARENCAEIAPRLINTDEINVAPDGNSLTYSGQSFDKARDPWLQPYSSKSLWNISLGSAAQWSGASDADTIDLQTAGAKVNAGQWSTPYFFGDSAAVLRRVQNSTLLDQLLGLPGGFHLSLPVNGNDSFVLMEPNRRYIYHYQGCQPTADGYSCIDGLKDDSCSDGLTGFDVGRGIMRKWEIESGTIRHTIRFALPRPLVKSSSTVAWPAQGSAVDATYTGNVVYGSTIGIPASIDLSTLGLSRGGLILAKALQDYGALQRDITGPSGGIDFYAEELAESLPEVAEMRADLSKLTPHLRVLRNQSPTTINGGGIRRQSALPSLDPRVCP